MTNEGNLSGLVAGACKTWAFWGVLYLLVRGIALLWDLRYGDLCGRVCGLDCLKGCELMGIGLDRVHNCDCVKGMKGLEAGSVDLAFADPPFNIGYQYDVYEDRRAAEEYLAWTKEWGGALVRALKAEGSFWLAIGDDFGAELKIIFQRELGLSCRSWVIWYYTFGVNCKA